VMELISEQRRVKKESSEFWGRYNYL